jgi:hypothetical protein
MKLPLILSLLLIARAALGFDAVLTDDTTVPLTGHSTNTGAKPKLSIDADHNALVKFDLTSLPPGTTSTNVKSATLTVFVDSVTLPKPVTSSTVNLLQVSGTWSELEAPGGLSFSSMIEGVALTREAKGNFVRFDVTALVKGWISGTVDNDGFALAAAGATPRGVMVALDSKENPATSHEAALDIELDAHAGAGDFADFFALMPPNNAATVAAGSDVEFPQNGPNSGTGLIARTANSTFQLSNAGTYLVTFQVSVSEAGQLVLSLNGTEVPSTTVGRATGTSQITEACLVTTTASNSVLTVRNPAGNPTALTITPVAGGTKAVSAHVVILRVQ